jgi:signal recognition particle subunit SRP54
MRGQFTFEDFLKSIKQMRKMGGIGAIAKLLPGGDALKQAASQMNESQVNRTEAIIYSMTAKERTNPKILNGSRRARIAQGAGVEVSDVNRLIKQFNDAGKMMKQMQKQVPQQGGKKKGKKKPKKPKYGLPGSGFRGF